MPETQQTLYALPDCQMQYIDARGLALIRIDNGAVALMDAGWRAFLRDLRVFRTLEEHAKAICARLPELRGHEAELAEGFRQLLPRGVLYSADEVVAQMETSRALAPDAERPLTLCIRTCERPRNLQQLLESLRDNARRFETRWPIEVLDDSREPASRDANRALCEAFAADLALAYVGAEEQEAMLAALCARHPEDSEALRWLLDAAHPDHVGKPTHGRLYNLAFLRHAGQRILLLDDDASLTAWRRPDVRPEPRFHLISGVSAAFASLEQARAALVPYERDPIADHANCLGLPVAEAIVRLTGQVPTPALFAGLPLDLVPHPYARPGRIRYTHNGFFGDTGTTSDHARLFDLGRTLPAVVANPELYKKFCQAPRFDFTAADRPELINGTHFHHTTCAGIDLAAFIPPVVPHGRSEDALLAGLLRLLHPGDYGLCLPFALEHRLHQASPWIFEPSALQQVPDLAAVLGHWVNHLVAPAEVEPAHRLRLLMESVATMARADLLQTRLHAIIERMANEDLTYQLAATQRALPAGGAAANDSPTSPPALPADNPYRVDIERIAQWVAEHLQDPSLRDDVYAHLPELAAGIQRFTQALPAWQRAFEAQAALAG